MCNFVHLRVFSFEMKLENEKKAMPLYKDRSRLSELWPAIKIRPFHHDAHSHSWAIFIAPIMNLFQTVRLLCFFLPFYSTMWKGYVSPAQSCCNCIVNLCMESHYDKYNKPFRTKDIVDDCCGAVIMFCTGVGYSSPGISLTVAWNRLVGAYKESLFERISWFLISLGLLFYWIHDLFALGLIGFAVGVTLWSSPCPWSHVEIGYWVSVSTVLVEWCPRFR